MSRPLVCLIDEAALAHNLAVMQSVAPNAPLWAVAKARGYGHGLGSALQGFSAAAGIAVLELEEAAYLRAQGWQKPILLLEGLFRPEDLKEAAHLHLDLALHNEEQAAALLSAAPAAVAYLQSRGRIWVKLNTGMNRLGFSIQNNSLENLLDIVSDIRAALGVGRLGFLMHFAQAELLLAAEEPFARFTWALEQLRHGAGEPLSIANSAAAIHLPFARMGWMRPGIALYGASPFHFDRGHVPVFAALGLRAAQTLQTELIAIQEIQAGEGVGYGLRFRASAPMRIGVAAVGYADGYPRTAPDGTPVFVDGKRCAVAGQVSMDLLTIDLSAAPEARVGSTVELWGAALPVDEVASHCGTVGYELLTAITPRVARGRREGSPAALAGSRGAA